MNLKYQLIGVIALTFSFFACKSEINNQEKQHEPVTENTLVSTSEATILAENETTNLPPVELDFASQWNEILVFFKNGDKHNLEKYLNENNELYDAKAWQSVDFLLPEFYNTVSKFQTFEEMPEVQIFGKDVKTVKVFMNDKSFGSVCHLYFEIQGENIWILGCAFKAN